MDWFSIVLRMKSKLLDMDYNVLCDLTSIFLSNLISLLLSLAMNSNLSHLDPSTHGISLPRITFLFFTQPTPRSPSKLS